MLYLIPNGLSNPEKPEYGSWGGRFNPYPNRMNTFIDAMDEHPESDDEMRKAYWTVARWNKAANLDFAARMDWCVKTFDEANHPPQVKLKHKNDLWVKAGSRIDLNAQGTTDPDGDELSYKWWHYKEAGNCSGEIEIENATEKAAFFTAPSNIDEEKILHVICEVTDNGSPNLCCYQRVVIRIQP